MAYYVLFFKTSIKLDFNDRKKWSAEYLSKTNQPPKFEILIVWGETEREKLIEFEPLILVFKVRQVDIEHESNASDRIENWWQRCFACRVYIFSMTDKVCFISIASLVNIIKHYKVIFHIQNSLSFHLLPNFIIF